MDKMGYPQGLIRYATDHALVQGLDARAMWKRVFRPRTLVYGSVLLVIVGVAAGMLVTRNPLKVDIIRDRGALAREAGPGLVENVYRMQLMNTDEKPRQVTISAIGLPGISVAGVTQPLALDPASARLIPLRLQVPVEAQPGIDVLKPGTHKIEFIIQAQDDEKVVRHEQSSFIIPH